MPPKQAVLKRLLTASLVLSTLVYAQGAPKIASKEPDKSVAEKLIRSAILSQKFKGGNVSELMLSDPERSGSGYRYLGEFTVRQSGKMIHCEEWRFVLQEKINGWMADETIPGRCND